MNNEKQFFISYLLDNEIIPSYHESNLEYRTQYTTKGEFEVLIHMLVDPLFSGTYSEKIHDKYEETLHIFVDKDMQIVAITMEGTCLQQS